MLVAFFTSVYYYSHFSTNLNWISIFWNFIIFGKTLYCIYSAQFSESVIKKWSSTIFCFAALFCPLLPSAIIIDTNEYLVCVYTLKFFENCQQEIDNSKISSFVLLYTSSTLQAGVVARKKELQQLYYKKILNFFKKLINFQWN